MSFFIGYYGWVVTGDKMLPLAFTGHRKVKGAYTLDTITVSNLRHILFSARQWGFDDFRCGMAVGSDQTAYQIALELGFNLHAYVPFKGFELKWPKARQEELKELLKKAAKVYYVSEPPYYAYKMVLRDKVMVQDTSLVITVWDGREEGGTWQTIKYAKELNIPVYNVLTEEWV